LPLEKHFFRQALDQNQVTALKKLCESYQVSSRSLWKPSILRPYSCYFGFLTALKSYRALQELDQWAYLEKWQDQPIEILDFGAGTLGASIGATQYLREKGFQVSGVTAIDRDLSPMEWAREEFKEFLPEQVRFSRRWPSKISPRIQLILMGNVWTEIWRSRTPTFEKIFSAQIRSFGPSVITLIMEPADKATNQKLLHLRNEVRHHTNILLPCTHDRPCPALAQDEWCHEEIDYRAPARFWELVRLLKFRKSRLNFSLLALGHQPSAFSLTDARIVSQDIGGKGKCDKWLCSEGKRWKASLQKKHRCEENQNYYDSPRGGVVDSKSLDSWIKSVM
jgi:hypothetical protein